MSNRQRIDELREERWRLQSRIDIIDKEVRQLTRADTFAEHSCTCVRANRDINVFDTRTVERARRNVVGIGGGFIADLVSADRDCKRCDGTGVPKAAEVEGAPVKSAIKWVGS